MQKLELTWIGKDDARQPLEPRILIENPKYSYGVVEEATLPSGKPWHGNMLIHGDNLLALRSLATMYAGEVKCIYIDPPFNTGNAFEHYDDMQEHSIWLNLMRTRFELLHTLLSDSGILMVHLDDTEMAYCKVLLDEVFGRKNYLNTISLTTNEPSGFKATASTLFSTANYILLYAKNRQAGTLNKVFIEKAYDKAYSKVILNIDEPYNDWKFSNISDILKQSMSEVAWNSLSKDEKDEAIRRYAITNARKVFRTAAIGGGAKIKRQATIECSKIERNKVFVHPNEDVDGFYIMNGEQILIYANRLTEIEGQLVPGQLLTDIWTDIQWTGIANEGNVVFKNGKKPEKLIKRCLEMTTREGDIVLDSFLGSGTTAAVAHKMNRRYIGIEIGNQAYEHDFPRLKNIVANNDSTGISRVVGWQGGGGFKFYELAPSLLRRDEFGQLVINPEYNADQLAAAMAMQEGYVYAPSSDTYWKQGRGAERDYIFTTTQFITAEAVDRIAGTMAEGESLLICCTACQKEARNRHAGITVKKIPQMLLKRCEFDRDNYNLNIVCPPQVDETDEDFND